MQTTATISRPPLISALSLALLFGVASVVHADHISPRSAYAVNDAHMTADGNLVDVQVRVDGRTAPLFFRPGRWDRHYFQAFKGRNYSLVVHNNTGRRVGVLLAVDGLNVVNGELSGLSHDEPMYVLDPNEQAVIRGWRTSLDEVRRFVFVDEERSYAERTGQSNSDLGWIRVLAFREVEPIGWWDRWGQYRGRSNSRDKDAPRAPERRELGNEAPKPSPSDQAAPAPEAKPDMADNRTESRLEGEGLTKAQESSPGTGWGDRRHDPVRRTEFQAEVSPTDQLALRYEYAAGLRALGIYPRRPRLWDRENGNLGFAQPPRW